MLRKLPLSENPVASTPLKEKAGFLLRNLSDGVSGICYGNSDCDSCKEAEVGALSDCSCERPLSSSVPLVMLLAHGCHSVPLLDKVTDLL